MLARSMEIESGERKTIARALAALLEAEPDELERFRRRKLKADSAVSLEQLRWARSVLSTIGRAIAFADAKALKAVRQAYVVACTYEDEEIEPDPAEEPAIDETPADPDEAVRASAAVVFADRSGGSDVSQADSSADLRANSGNAKATPSSDWSGGTGTIGLDSAPTSPSSSVPFEAGQFRPAAATTAEARSDDAGETIAFAGESGESTPFSGPGEQPGGVPVMTVQEYAHLRASCVADPSKTNDLYGRQGATDPAAHEALDAYWTARLAKDAVEARLFQALLDRLGRAR